MQKWLIPGSQQGKYVQGDPRTFSCVKLAQSKSKEHRNQLEGAFIGQRWDNLRINSKSDKEWAIYKVSKYFPTKYLLVTKRGEKKNFSEEAWETSP